MERVRSCGRHGVLPGGGVRVRASGSAGERRAGYAGLATCGSVWACPVCSERILAGRQVELADALTAHAATGGVVAMVTLTMRHNSRQSLRQLWDALSYAWDATVGGRRTWKATRDRYGVDGWVRVVETTHGEHGWHVHVHAGLMLPAGTTAADVANLGAEMFQPWRAALMRKGLAAPLAGSGGLSAVLWSSDQGQAFGDYFAKGVYDGDASRAALELARGDLKQARSGNRTPFRILADFLEHGVADDLELWEEWERGSKGRRQLTWSRGLRERLALAAERSDEDLAADELGSAADDLVELDATSWRTVTEHGWQAELLDLAELDDGGHALRRFLAGRGLAFLDARPLVHSPPG